MQVSEAEARRIYQEMIRDELEMLRAQPEMRVQPYGAGGPTIRVRYCSRSELESVARRESERAVERLLRNKESTTEA